jgi:hypothetical protein
VPAVYKSIAEKEFTATGDKMEIELSFSVDESKFTKETAAAAFEKKGVVR